MPNINFYLNYFYSYFYHPSKENQFLNKIDFLLACQMLLERYILEQLTVMGHCFLFKFSL